MVNKYFSRYWVLLALTLISCLPLLWFRRGYLLYSEESTFLNYGFIWDKYRALWSTHLNHGYTHYFYPFLFLHAPYWKLLTLTGLPLIFIQRSFSVMIWSLVVLASYKFLRLFTSSRLAALAGVCLYLLNFYVTTTIFYTAKIWQLFLLPAGFFLTTSYLKTRKSQYLFLNFLTLYLFQGIFCNLGQTASTFLAYPLAFLFYAITEKPKLRKALVSFTLYCLPILAIVGFNLWIFSLNLTPEERKIALSRNIFESLATDAVKIMQLRGAWWEETPGPENIPYNHLADFYHHPGIVIASLLIFSASFLPLLIRRTSPTYFFWLGVLGLFLFLAKGTAPPVGELFAWLYNKFLLLRVFREPWSKFIPWVIFACSVLITLTITTLKNLARKWPRFFSYLLVILILLRGYPFFTPKIVDHTNKGWKRMDVKLPDFWLAAATWSKNHKEESVFILPEPRQTTKDYYFQWYPESPGNFKGPLPFLLLSSNLQWNNYIDGFWSRGQRFATFIQYFHPSVLDLLGADYVLVMKDVRPTSLSDIKFFDLSPLLGSQPIADFGEGKIQIFAPKNQTTNLFYIPKTEVAYFGDTEGLGATLSLVEPSLPTLIRTNPPQEKVSSQIPTVVSYLTNFDTPQNREGCLFCGKLNLPQAGTYEVLTANQPLRPEAITLDQKLLTPKVNCPATERWQSFGSLNLSAGEHSVQITLPSTQNIAKGQWQKIQEGLGETYSTLYLQEVDNWQPERTYQLMITYQGHPVIYLVEKIVDWDKIAHPQEPLNLQQTPTITRISSSFSPEEALKPRTANILYGSDTFAAAATFLAASKDPNQELAILDWKIRVLPTNPRLFLRRVEEKKLAANSLPLPEVAYQKISSTKYWLTITKPKNPFALVFNQSYHEGWKITSKKPSTDSKDPEHFLANGFANGWLIDPANYHRPEKIEFVIEFAPQKIYLVGIVATGVMAITCVTMLLLNFCSRLRLRL